MGGIELAWEVKDYTEVLLCSEELFPADSWSYEALDSIINDPDIISSNIAEAFCQSAIEYFGPSGVNAPFVLSAVDLSKMNLLSSAINELSDELITWIGSSVENASMLNGFAEESTITEDGYYIDLAQYLGKLNDLQDSELNILSTTVLQELENVIFYSEFNSIEGYIYDEYGGLSIFHNGWNYEYSYPIATYENLLRFGSDSNWTDYLNTMEQMASEGI